MNPPDHNELTDEPSNPSNCSGINEELRERENQIQRGQCKARKRNFKEGLKVVGGDFPVLLGRKDSLVSKASSVEGNIPRPNQSMDQLIKIFARKGLTIYDMVALNGAHTIGFSHCKEFSDRLFHFNKTTPTDPDLNPLFASALKVTCEKIVDLGVSVVNDLESPTTFDNVYYKSLSKGLGLLKSDNALLKDPRTKPIVLSFAADQTLFFRAFSRAMEKLSIYNVKTGQQGQIRRVCDAFN
ncbi:hypothetical protein F8388_012283 [Cannabis sativa]|uniref:peroxidase n=2 Tax=Cannabis sativa TaxID=3483 RepID=A0A7J6ECH0_CANSA|nr:hypothetical protein F8388_012283 [Cannabis sativa]